MYRTKGNASVLYPKRGPGQEYLGKIEPDERLHTFYHAKRLSVCSVRELKGGGHGVVGYLGGGSAGPGAGCSPGEVRV